MPPHLQDEIHAESLRDPEGFWTRHAAELYWHKKPSRALKVSTKRLKDGTTHPSWTWFPDGEISTCYNCVDRHVHAGHGDQVAIIWDSPVSGSKEKFTYNQLLREVETLAGVLREEGVKKGDIVLIYSRTPSASELSYILTIHYSAYDPCCPLCHARNQPPWCHSRRSLRWFLGSLARTTNRSFKA